MPPIIRIPEPCYENWNSMQPAEQGRHCNACCKKVIDFTTWEPSAIAGYLADPTNTKTCGRFHKTQLNVGLPASLSEWTERICHSSLSEFRKIAAVIVVVFAFMGTGCQKPLMDKAVDRLFHKEPDIIVGALELPDLVVDTVIAVLNDSLPVCSKDTIAESDMIQGLPAMRLTKGPGK